MKEYRIQLKKGEILFDENGINIKDDYEKKYDYDRIRSIYFQERNILIIGNDFSTNLETTDMINAFEEIHNFIFGKLNEINRAKYKTISSRGSWFYEEMIKNDNTCLYSLQDNQIILSATHLSISTINEKKQINLYDIKNIYFNTQKNLFLTSTYINIEVCSSNDIIRIKISPIQQDKARLMMSTINERQYDILNYVTTTDLVSHKLNSLINKFFDTLYQKKGFVIDKIYHNEEKTSNLLILTSNSIIFYNNNENKESEIPLFNVLDFNIARNIKPTSIVDSSKYVLFITFINHNKNCIQTCSWYLNPYNFDAYKNIKEYINNNKAEQKKFLIELNNLYVKNISIFKEYLETLNFNIADYEKVTIKDGSDLDIPEGTELNLYKNNKSIALCDDFALRDLAKNCDFEKEGELLNNLLLIIDYKDISIANNEKRNFFNQKEKDISDKRLLLNQQYLENYYNEISNQQQNTKKIDLKGFIVGGIFGGTAGAILGGMPTTNNQKVSIPKPILPYHHTTQDFNEVVKVSVIGFKFNYLQKELVFYQISDDLFVDIFLPVLDPTANKENNIIIPTDESLLVGKWYLEMRSRHGVVEFNMELVVCGECLYTTKMVLDGINNPPVTVNYKWKLDNKKLIAHRFLTDGSDDYLINAYPLIKNNKLMLFDEDYTLLETCHRIK